MKIAFSWLKSHLPVTISVNEVADLLTFSGLEVENIEKVEAVKGGLEGLVVGEVITCEKHPDADKLSITTVNVGGPELLNIVCGAPNVAKGQKVIVATVGAELYPSEGETFKIKKSKIRGAVSEGMICAEDEIGLGNSHAGIMVLDPETEVGTPAASYFNLESDYVLEIGLTPNRADAMSHYGVARDLRAVMLQQTENVEVPALAPIDIEPFAFDSKLNPIEIQVEDSAACPRYVGLSFHNVKVGPSPDWLKQKLEAIGLRPINNVVDITNYVHHDLGQPLHAFDEDKIAGKKVIVKKLAQDTPFQTLDEQERKLSANDLMICDENGGMCIAGVFGGLHSGVTSATTKVFLESAYFNPVSVRKTARYHGLNTDASFRFERGIDPEITVHAIKKAARLMKEICGATIVSDIFDYYPEPISKANVELEYDFVDRLIGEKIPHNTIIEIIESLGIQLIQSRDTGLKLAVPAFKNDVKQPADVVEEILRVYGYNRIGMSNQLHMNLSYGGTRQAELAKSNVANFLVSRGFYETMSNSLTKSSYYANKEGELPAHIVELANPLSTELDVMRNNLLFSGLENISYNVNRQQTDLKLFEFGATYTKTETSFVEQQQLSIFCTGKREIESWEAKQLDANFYFLKGIVEGLLQKAGLSNKQIILENIENEHFAQAVKVSAFGKELLTMGILTTQLTKKFDVKIPVAVAIFQWKNYLNAKTGQKTEFGGIPKFPMVRRDLALLVDKQISFNQLEQLAWKSERKLLKQVNLFDVYEGDKLPAGKKSLALSFTLRDDSKTLTDVEVEQVMQKLLKNFEREAGAELRK